MFFSKLTFTRQQFKNMKEKCAESPSFCVPPIQGVLANLPQPHPRAVVVARSSLACGFWAFSVRELVWVLVVLLCCKTPKLLTFLLSMGVETWLSVMFHFTDLITFHLYSESNKCTVSKILQVLLLFQLCLPTACSLKWTKENGQKAAGFMDLLWLAFEGRVWARCTICWSQKDVFKAYPCYSLSTEAVFLHSQMLSKCA